MSNLNTSKSKVAAIGALGVLATGLVMTAMLALAPVANAASLTSQQVQSILSLLTSFGADSATVASVNSALTGAAPASASLKIGSRGAAVSALQKELIAGGYKIPAGATGYYGAQTAAAVKARDAFNASSAPVVVATTTPAVTGNVTVTATSPSSVIVAGQAIANLGSFTFNNTSNADVKVTNLSFKRTGVSNDSALANVYLYNGAVRITDSAGVSNASFNFNDPSGIVVVPAGRTLTVSVLADIAKETSGQQVGVALTAVTSNGTMDVNYPVTAGVQSVSAATMASVDFSSTLPSVTSVNAQNDYVMWQNTVTVGTRAVTLKSFQLRNIGSIKSSDITNLRLFVDGVQVGKSSVASDNTVTFDLTANPAKLETGGRVMKVVGDIVGGSNSSFSLSLRRASDAQMIDTDLNQPVLATVNGNSFTTRTATSATIASGTVSVTKANSSPSSDVSLNASGIKLATFELRASGEDVKVTSLNVQVTTPGSRGLQNGKVFLNGAQAGSTKSLSGTVTFDLNSSMILKSGSTAIVDIYADTKTSTGASYSNGDSVSVALTAGDSNAQGLTSLNSLNVPAGTVSGSTISMSSSSASVTKYSGYSDHTFIAGTTGAKVGSFVISSGSTEGINVNTITLTLSNTEKDMVTDLKIVGQDGVQVGSTKPVVSNSNSFSTNIVLAASATKSFDVYANIKSTATGSFAANIDGSGNGATTGTSVTFGDSSSNTLQNITIDSGVLTPSISTGSTPNNSNVVAGSLVKVGSFNFNAQYSSYSIDKINVKVPNNAATSVESITLKYPNKDGVNTDSVAYLVSPSTSQSYATATFTGLTFYVPAGTAKTLDVYVKVNSVQADGDSGKSVFVAIDSNGFNATDSSGNATTTISSMASNSTSGKGTIVVRKALPTLSSVAIGNSTLNAGTNKSLAKVKVSTTGDISWSQLAFTVSKTSAVTLTDLSLYEGSTVVATSTLSSGTVVFTPANEQQISSDVTYELRGTVGGLASGNNYVDVSIANPSTSPVTDSASNVTGSFVWSDRSSVSSVHSTTTSDWTNDYLVGGLILSLATLSSNI